MTAAPRFRQAVEAVAPAEAFRRQEWDVLERALAASVTGLGSGLAWVEAASSKAVGLGGRGGRRWRPILALAGAEATGHRAPAAEAVAVAVELTHTASLVLDDLPCMDDADIRRGQAATHRLVGTAGAILVSVGFLARAAELLGGVPGCGATLARDWGRAIGLDGMAGGQAVDVAQSGAARAAARRLYRRKTTALAALAASGGARASGASEATARALHGFGLDLGWAYQLADDADDAGEDDAAGREAGGRSPRRQAAYLLRRAERRLADCPGLTPAGRTLLADLARTLVPLPATAAGAR